MPGDGRARVPRPDPRVAARLMPQPVYSGVVKVGGRPLAGAHVCFTGRRRRWTRTDDDGRFRVVLSWSRGEHMLRIWMAHPHVAEGTRGRARHTTLVFEKAVVRGNHWREFEVAALSRVLVAVSVARDLPAYLPVSKVVLLRRADHVAISTARPADDLTAAFRVPAGEYKVAVIAHARRGAVVGKVTASPARVARAAVNVKAWRSVRYLGHPRQAWEVLDRLPTEVVLRVTRPADLAEDERLQTVFLRRPGADEFTAQGSYHTEKDVGLARLFDVPTGEYEVVIATDQGRGAGCGRVKIDGDRARTVLSAAAAGKLVYDRRVMGQYKPDSGGGK